MTKPQNETNPTRPFFRKSDFLIISLLLILAVIIMYAKYTQRDTKNLRLEIYYDHKLAFEKPLDQVPSGEFTVDGMPGFVFLADGQGGVKILESPCPDKVCVHAGTLHYDGDMAICIPEKVVFKLVGPTDAPSEEAVDIIIGQGKTEK